ncbi:MAG TPA: hypothetical protein VMT24_14670, partial [Aggregatilineaceae bacterium]|nr:hypothetical protein [Aggregatilineaceae bacterium]
MIIPHCPARLLTFAFIALMASAGMGGQSWAMVLPIVEGHAGTSIPVWFTPLPDYNLDPGTTLTAVMNGNAAFQTMMNG